MSGEESLNCPFCPVQQDEFGQLQLHIARRHPDADSKSRKSAELTDAEVAQLLAFEEAGIPSDVAFETTDSSATPPESDQWIDCHCGERIPLEDYDLHAQMHDLENMGTAATRDSTPEPDYHVRSTARSKHKTSSSNGRLFPLFDVANWKKQSSPDSTETKTGTRLGKSELGPYAYENQMPDHLKRLIMSTPSTPQYLTYNGFELRVDVLQNETTNLVTTLKKLSEADRSVRSGAGHFCHPGVNHVGKLPCEGGFCGYRNIQMLVSYIRGCKEAPGHSRFSGKLPTIIQLQDMIENAWAHGYNSNGRLETGGIRGTRKHIGTSEAQALFQSLRIPCEAEAIRTQGGQKAADQLTERMKLHFSVPDSPPVYLQHKGHSMTVVGWEDDSRSSNGPRESNGVLIMFDPMFNISKGLKALAARGGRYERETALLRAHRYGRGHFKRYNEFELLILDRPA